MSTIRPVRASHTTRASRPLWPVLALALAGCPATPPQLVDPDLAAYIDAIKAVDNHAHPMLPVAQGRPADTDFDALPLDGIPPFPLPWRITLDNPEWGNVARALYGLEPRDSGQALIDGRARRMASEGAQFGDWVLDQTGIDVMLANRITMGPGLEAPRFRWVPFDDALMLPLDIRGEAARTPDTRSLYPKEAAILARYLKDLGLKQVPVSLDDYVARVVRPTLDRQRQAGAVAIKFEAAYLRPLDFDDPNPQAARAVYARYARGGTPTHAD